MADFCPTEIVQGYADMPGLDQIYKLGAFQYSLPRDIIERWLNGIGFGEQPKYSPEEKKSLIKEIQTVWNSSMDRFEQWTRKQATSSIKSIAHITAGAPGAGKTWILNRRMEELGGPPLATDPDDMCLKRWMLSTYHKDLANGMPKIDAYNKWRAGSNAFAHILLAHFIKEKYSFFFGTTATSPLTYKLFEQLKSQGYQIHLIHVSAPDGERWESIQERDKQFIQTTEEDIKEKGKLLPQRINDTFLKYADQIEFYYRSKYNQDAVIAATWIRNDQSTSPPRGQLVIYDLEAYRKIIDLHNAACNDLNRPDLLWENTLEKALMFEEIQESTSEPSSNLNNRVEKCTKLYHS